MLSSREIDEHIEFITSRLDTLTTGDGNLSECVEIGARFEALRDQYRHQPDTLAGCLQQLPGLRGRFDDLLADRLALVVDRFNEVNEQIHRADQEKAFWRDFLIRRSTQSGRQHLDGITATVRVRSIQSRTLPKTGGDERARLEDLIRESGRWHQVSQLSRPQLERALADNLFTGPQAGAIEQLCPATVRYQVSCSTPDR